MTHNYPAGVTDADFDDRGAFQGDVSRREVEITISVDAEMVNHEIRSLSEDQVLNSVLREVRLELRKSWEDEQEEKKTQ